MTNYWFNQPDEYTSLPQTSLVKALHPAILEELNSFNPESLLDFGCGDGKLLEKISGVKKVVGFDSSPGMIELSRKRLKDQPCLLTTNPLDFREITFDAVVCSVVTECISDEEELKSVIKNIHDRLNPGGLFLLGNTHPCFRNQQFSDFKTDFSKDKKFNYLNNGQSFEVQMKEGRKAIRFTDNHWPLSYMVNLCISTGFVLKRLVEVHDIPGMTTSNPNASPYLLQVYAKPEDVVNHSVT